MAVSQLLFTFLNSIDCLQTVENLYKIRVNIVAWLDVLFISQFLDQISLMRCNFLVNSCKNLVSHILMVPIMFFVTWRVLLVKVFSFHQTVIFRSKLIVMPTGQVVPWLDDRLLVIIFSLVMLLYRGSPRNNPQCHVSLLNQNIALWLPPLVNWYGYIVYLLIFLCLILNQCSCTAIINPLYTLLLILCFMSALNTSRSTTTSFVSIYNLASLLHNMFQRTFNYQIS